MSVAPCLFAWDDETYSYNHHINRWINLLEGICPKTITLMQDK